MTASTPSTDSLHVAIVTGATGGMGREIVADLARDHQVIAIGRSESALAELAALPQVTAVAADLVADLVTGAAAAEGNAAVLSRLAELAPRADVLVHAAAVGTPISVEAATLADWQQQFNLNVFVPALLTRALLPQLRAAGGTVVFINSGAGSNAQPGNSVYAGTKHALRGIANSLRKEEANNGVRVTTVSPGPTDTQMLRDSFANQGLEYRTEQYIVPQQIAAAVRLVVDADPSSQVTEVDVRPRVELAERR